MYSSTGSTAVVVQQQSDSFRLFTAAAPHFLLFAFSLDFPKCFLARRMERFRPQ